MMEQNIMLRPQMPNQSIVIFIAISRLTRFSLNHSGSLATKTGSSCRINLSIAHPPPPCHTQGPPSQLSPHRIQSRTHAFFKASSKGIMINHHKCLFLYEFAIHTKDAYQSACHFHMWWAKGPPLSTAQNRSTIMAKLYPLYPCQLCWGK